MLNAFAWAAGALLIADTALHLIALAKKGECLRRVTKALLMPLLALTFLLFWTDRATGSPPWLVIAGLLMGCAGDIFLFNHHHPVFFPLGMASFAAGHVLYIIQMFSVFTAPAWWIIALLVAAYLTIGTLILKSTQPFVPKKLVPAGIFYILLLCTLGITAASGMIAGFSAGALVLYIGTLCFQLSDSILSFEIFRGDTKNGNIRVMASYIAGQALIAAGFFMLLA